MKKIGAASRTARSVWAGALCFAAAVFPACGRGGAGGETSKGPVVLEVGPSRYTVEDFNGFVRSSVGDDGAALDPAALSRLFDEFRDEKLFLSRARSSGVVLAEGEKTAYLSKLGRETAGEAAAELAEAGKAVILERLVVEKYLAGLTKDIDVGEEEISAYYAGHKSDFLQPERVQVSQILVDSEGKASTIRERLRGATEDDFRAVARRDSAGPEAAKGGIMGVFSPGQLPQELESFILPLREGEISRVVGSSYGFHIFRLDKRMEARLTSLADASPSIRARLLDEKGRRAVADHLAELKRSPDWQDHLDRLPFVYQRNENT
jgi:hypothetical protein